MKRKIWLLVPALNTLVMIVLYLAYLGPDHLRGYIGLWWATTWPAVLAGLIAAWGNRQATNTN